MTLRSQGRLVVRREQSQPSVPDLGHKPVIHLSRSRQNDVVIAGDAQILTAPGAVQGYEIVRFLLDKAMGMW